MKNKVLENEKKRVKREEKGKRETSVQEIILGNIMIPLVCSTPAQSTLLNYHLGLLIRELAVFNASRLKRKDFHPITMTHALQCIQTLAIHTHLAYRRLLISYVGPWISLFSIKFKDAMNAKHRVNQAHISLLCFWSLMNGCMSHSNQIFVPDLHSNGQISLYND